MKELTDSGFLSSACVLVGLLILGAGCGSFQRDWKSALNAPIPEKDITGPWAGSWISEKNGHRGRLRGIFTRLEPGRIEARFHATYWKILRASYEVPLQTEEIEGGYRLEGEVDLGGLMGGLYQYEGFATPDHFHARYRSKHDRGTFEMTRPEVDGGGEKER